MKVYKIELMVIDFDQCGLSEIPDLIESARYPNRCISPKVVAIQERDIGEWRDDSPLNNRNTWEAEFERLFTPHANLQDEPVWYNYLGERVSP